MKSIFFVTLAFFLGAKAWALNAPGSLTATAVSTSQINLRFLDRSTNETGFIIERSLNQSSGYSEIVRLNANITSYNNVGLSADTTYYYRVRAYRVRSATRTVYSSYVRVSARTQTPPPQNASCSLPTTLGGGSIAHNQTVTAYQASSVPHGQSCVSQVRTCNNGALSGSYLYASCTVQPPTYSYSWIIGSFGACSATACGTSGTQTRSVTCRRSDGATVADSECIANVGAKPATSQACSAPACQNASCTLPASLGGGTLAHNQAITAYQASSVAYGQTCSSQVRTCNNGSLSGSYLYSSCTVQPPPTANSNLFEVMPSSGTVVVTLNPGPSVPFNQSHRVIFGMPFPLNAVANVNNIRVLNAADQEIPSQVSILNSWRRIDNPSQAVSIRSARIVIDQSFSSLTPIQIKVQYGVARTLNISGTIDTKSTWVNISQGVNPSEYPTAENIMEPSVYATLPPDWMGKSVIQSRSLSLNEVSTYNWFDNAFVNFSNTAAASNQVTNYEPWLYDRAQTFFIRYARSGDVNWLRRAHRVAQFYKNKIQSNGQFALKAGDAKYVYGQSMNYNYMMTGDTTLLPVIERALQPHAGWPTAYSASLGFWTERNAAYALHAALAAFDATGSATHAQRATALFNGYFNHQQNPGNGWSKIGCQLHTRNQHDPSEAIPDVLCSTWMGALLADAVFKYYLMSHATNNNALIYLNDYSDFIINYGLYTSGGYRLAYYAASSTANSGADGDREHSCDVLGALAKGLYAGRALNRNTNALETQVALMTTSCEANLGSASLSPARKYNWWFGTTSEFSWLLNNLPN